MQRSRWFAIGRADGSMPEPGLVAAGQALAHSDAKLLIVFCSQGLDLGAVVGQIRARSGGVPLIGCSTAGEIATSGPSDVSVVVAALGGSGLSVATAAAANASRDLRAAGAHAAGCVAATDDLPHRILVVLSDGLAGDQQEVVWGAYSVLGPGVPLVGGCAGDDLKMTRTFQFCDDQVLTGAVVAAGIASDGPFGIGVRHGWRRTGDPLLVTGATGNRVQTLDDEPALDVYLRRLAISEPASSDELGRIAMQHPFGLSRPGPEEHVRGITGCDLSDRSLTCMAEVPRGGLVWMMEAAGSSVLDATDGACQDSLAALDGEPPVGMLVFDCIARKGVLGESGIKDEIDRVASRAGEAPVAGFYTYGEIARARGINGFHNQTIVVFSMA